MHFLTLSSMALIFFFSLRILLLFHNHLKAEARYSCFVFYQKHSSLIPVACICDSIMPAVGLLEVAGLLIWSVALLIIDTSVKCKAKNVVLCSRTNKLRKNTVEATEQWLKNYLQVKAICGFWKILIH